MEYRHSHPHRSPRRWRIAALLAVAATALLVAVTNVPTGVTAADREALRSGFGIPPAAPPLTFEEEVRRITAIQRAVFAVAPVGAGIPEGEAREPLNLLMARQGLCFDRSRTMEKAFQLQGMEVRHVFLIFGNGRGFLRALLTRGQPSHAVTEVRTRRGWLLVDSNTPWIALAPDSQPVPARGLAGVPVARMPRPDYLEQRYWAIPGLYSRKGTLYPPYVVLLPKLNWGDFLRGLLSS